LGTQVSLYLFDPAKLVGQFLDGADFGLLLDSDAGFADVGERPFQMRAQDGIQTVLMKTRSQIDIGSLKLSEQRPPQPFETI
jgi:hypothetical protein